MKKLIEVALPLDKINEACAREKSIRHGHPSTLHLWWARRPLAAARAVIWASLVDAPSSHPELFPTEEAQTKERQRLFGILEKLVVWENSNNQEVLDEAKAEILKYNNGEFPTLLDPFAGGGAIPLEAQRLGLKAIAHDLNPVAVMINKAMIEIPPRFAGKPPVSPDDGRRINEWHGAQGLAEDVRYYGEWMKKEAFKRIGHLYPKVQLPKEEGGGEATVIAWLWARTIKCPNPACGCHMPLFKSNIIAKNKAYVKVERDENGYPVFRVINAKDPIEEGTVNRKGAHCIYCNTPVSFSYIREQGKANNLGVQLMAVVAKGKKGRIYLTPDEYQKRTAYSCDRPDIDLGKIANYPGYLNTPAYGLENFQDLFTARQLTIFTELEKNIENLGDRIEKAAIIAGLKNDHVSLSNGGCGAKAYSEAIKVYLAFLIDKLADYNSAVCSWNAVGQKIRNTFGLTGMSMTWDYAEANPFSGASGSFDNMLEWVVKSIRNLPTKNAGNVEQVDAQIDSGLRNVVISTDPPYYSNVPYADFADFFYGWMRRNLQSVYPNLFKTIQTPKNEELVADPYRQGNKLKAAEYFENGMFLACKQMYKYSKDDVPVTIYYAFKESTITISQQKQFVSSTGWETMLSALIRSGFRITGTWPIRTERSGRTRSMNSNALASSIVLVCRKRSEDAPQTTRRHFIAELRRELQSALKKLQQSNIAPVDLAQASIGPGMGVFSKYSRVLEADGSEMSIRSALQVINEQVDAYFNEQVGSLDAESRFCVDLYMQAQYEDIPYGEAEILANAKGALIPKMVDSKVLYAKAGKVHLVRREELPPKVDSDESNVWRLTQQLTGAMAKGGIEECAKQVASLYGVNVEYAKDLAYRLYTVAEQKGWTAEAFAYNALIVSWMDIQSRAAELQSRQMVETSLFE
ncbi:DUF1156 domain-containing protein [Dialister succinatiphilus]|uniref:DUF1156 domain-containing protein n=1 Tax=Dialister succinatiphilus YIT 11850 TaxID=742743 RepID=H1D2Q6_9FIRM|nr:DUF1156 domain-containing protein [Dialister succinatiphilus]EHO62176.1 hypothetical protein HMPREF9453_01894 [Dialister succinatiphilus YIT 11850]